jgi:hypothetical protein
VADGTRDFIDRETDRKLDKTQQTVCVGFKKPIKKV